jgi:PAS domain S-box-containing protein
VGDYRRAYELSREAITQGKRAEQEKSSARLLKLAQRYQDESKQRRIDELTRRNEMQTNEHRWLLTVLAGSLLLFAGAVYFGWRLHSSGRQIRALNQGLEQRVQERTDELRQQARYLRTLIDTLPLRVWLKDTEGRYLTVSASGSLKGRLASEIIGKTDLDIWPGPVGAAHLASDLEVMSTRQTLLSETRWQVDGRTIWVEVDKAPVIDEDGSVLGTVGVARDISARKATEEAREAALSEAERLAQARSRFLAQMSHELRTPLNSILGYTQKLLNNTNQNDPQRTDLETVRSSGEHLLLLIGDILDFAKIDAGKMLLNPTDFRLGSFLDVIADLVRMRADQHGLHFLCCFSPDLPQDIHADELRLRQVLLNLLSNAIKFTEHGSVCLQVDFAPPGRLTFTVSDTGIGIAAEQLETIFQPFEQVGDARKQQEGTGLGLPISRAFVRLMGGDIEVESTPGVGSTFRFAIEVTVMTQERLSPPTNPPPLPEPTDSTECPPETAIVVPPATELDALHEVALQGRMRDILDYADRLDALDAGYHGFTSHLRLLAREYRSRAIVELVEQHLRQAQNKS